MDKKHKKKAIIIFSIILILIIVGIVFTNNPDAEKESIQVVMKDAVMHDTFRINFFGYAVNPAVISAFSVTGIFLVFSIIVRIFVIPKFKIIPGKFQLLLEQAVDLFSNMAKENSPHSPNFVSAYIFVAGAYIAVSTLFELFGFQAVTTVGTSIALPAPLSDINGAICMGCLSYLVILGGGIAKNGLKGAGKTLKDFSLPISMSFRLFGALLSGALVTELVYHNRSLAIGMPILVGILFTMLHALIQAYVLTTLVSTYFGEVTEKTVKVKNKKAKA